MKNYKKDELIEFIKESNAIERVYSKEMLDQSMLAWEFLVKQKELSVDIILKLHLILMEKSNLTIYEKGQLRRQPVWIGEKEAVNYTEINSMLKKWVNRVNKNIKIKNNTQIWKHIRLDHVGFEKIHPFIDGNGRTGRMLMNWERLQHDLPIEIIHADWPANPGEQRLYYTWFK
jgi:Fic family protein